MILINVLKQNDVCLCCFRNATLTVLDASASPDADVFLIQNV